MLLKLSETASKQHTIYILKLSLGKDINFYQKPNHQNNQGNKNDLIVISDTRAFTKKMTEIPSECRTDT